MGKEKKKLIPAEHKFIYNLKIYLCDIPETVRYIVWKHYHLLKRKLFKSKLPFY